MNSWELWKGWFLIEATKLGISILILAIIVIIIVWNNKK